MNAPVVERLWLSRFIVSLKSPQDPGKHLRQKQIAVSTIHPPTINQEQKTGLLPEILTQ